MLRRLFALLHGVIAGQIFPFQRFRLRRSPQANGVVMDVHPLVPHAVQLFRLGDHDFVNELVDNLPDEVSGTHIGIAAIGRTEEKHLLPLVVVGGAATQLTAIVGTVGKPGKHAHNARSRGPAAVPAEVLNGGKGFRSMIAG